MKPTFAGFTFHSLARLRTILLECVSDEEMAIIAGQLVVQAKLGDQAAIKLLFQYVLGKPAADGALARTRHADEHDRAGAETRA